MDPPKPTESQPPDDRDREQIEAARRQIRSPSDDLDVGAPVRPFDTIEGYDVLSEIHRGGQGIVYKAVQKTTKRTVALKVLLAGPYASPRQRHRFEREIDLVASLQHPNIVTVYDSGVTRDGRHFFAMEYVHGQPLGDYLSRNPLAVNNTLRLFQRICEAVNYAHQRGVIHRDLKPANIRIDASGQPHILDFGLAKTAGPDLSGGAPVTVTGEFMGTLAYASPEQTKGDPNLIDIRTDVYSLGVILYEMLTGTHPYEVVGQMADVLRNIAEAEPEKPSTIRRQVDDEVETIVLKALAKEKERRYQSADALGRDIEHYLSGEPIDAKRDSTWYVLEKSLRRYRVAATVALAFAVVLIAAAAVSTLLYARAESDRQRARRAENLAKQEAARVTTVNQFLQDIIASLNPESRHAERLSARVALDRAGTRLDEGLLDGQPEIEVPLRRLLADVDYTFCAYEKVERHLRRAVSLCEASNARQSTEVVEDLYDLAILAARRGRVADAARLLEEVLSRGSKVFGTPHPRLVLAEYYLAILRHDDDGARIAIDAYCQIPEVRSSLQHDNNERTAAHLARITMMLVIRGSFQEAESYCQRLVALDRELYGEQHVYFTYASEWLALVLETRGQLAQAEELLVRSLGIRRKALHERAPDVGFTLANLGRVLAKQGRLREAERALHDALSILDDGAPESWMPHEARSTLGGILVAQGKRSEAEQLLLDAYWPLVKHPLANSVRKGEAAGRIVRLYEAWDKPEQAAQWRAKLEQWQATTQPATKPATAQP